MEGLDKSYVARIYSAAAKAVAITIGTGTATLATYCVFHFRAAFCFLGFWDLRSRFFSMCAEHHCFLWDVGIGLILH